MQTRDFSDRIHREVAIESYISRYVNLKKRGNKLLGLCPFHTEKTPSFTVSPDVQLYYCFGCHKSGDIFRFVMDYEKVDFNRAKELLSEYSGIPLAGKKRESFDELYELNRKTAEYFHQNLFSAQGKEAMEYLKKRKITESDIKLFQIGFALPGYENLVSGLSNEEREQALKTGLIRERPKMKGSYYDFFRDRIMFPIRDVYGKVAGFGGRILNDSGEAKYINSSASPVYDKGRMFYNLNGAVESVRKGRKVILVEGYLDVIGLVSRNIPNVIAPLGTALTPEQVRVVKNYADRLVIMMDGDSAGRKAALSGCETALNEGLEAEIVLLESGEDPFDLSRKLTTEELQKKVEDTLPASRFIIQEIMGGVTPASSPEDKKRAVEALFQFVSGMKRETDKQAYLTEGARIIGVSETYVLKDFLLEKGSKSAVPETDINRDQSVKKVKSVSEQCERKIMAMLMRFPELFKYIGKVQEIEFQDEESAFVWEILYTRFMNQESIVPGDILMLAERGNGSAIAEYLIDNYEDNEEARDKIFNELVLRQKVAVIDIRLGQLDKNGMFADEMERISKMAYYKTEKEKILGFLRNLQ